MAQSCIRGGPGLVLGRGSAQPLVLVRHGTGAPGSGHIPKLLEVKERLDNTIRHLDFGWCCEKLGVGLDDSCWSLPTHDILLF